MAQLQVYLDDDKLKQIVEKVAIQQKRSVSFLIRQWIKEGLERMQAQSEIEAKPATKMTSKEQDRPRR